MPLLQGQPFKLIKDPEILPINSEIFKIFHTGEKFLSRSDYEDRLALYSQTIWTCQSTGKTGLTHEEAWTSEAKARFTINSLIPASLQKPLLVLVHHSLSPLEQLIDAAYILCHSQYHVGEELLLATKQILVRIVATKDRPKHIPVNEDATVSIVVNGNSTADESSLNGNSNGVSKNDSPSTSPGKENQTKDFFSESRDDGTYKREMLPKLYDVFNMADNTIIENVPSKQLQRQYKLPAKDQIRLFIRSSALRQRGSTCTPWVVAEDIVKQFCIPNKLPTVFLSPPKSSLQAAKRKSHSPIQEISKRSKQDLLDHKMVAPLVLKTENYRKSIFNIVRSPTQPNDSVLQRAVARIIPGKPGLDIKSYNKISPTNTGSLTAARNFSITKHPLSLGKPKILSKSSNFHLPKSVPVATAPKRRGRPPLTKEEKQRNKRLREATLFELSKKKATECSGQLLMIKTQSAMLSPSTSSPSTNNSSSGYLTAPSSHIHSPYKSPVKRATTPESIMKLPFMRRFIHEHKTIKGVIGQFRRLSHTMDIVLAKLSQDQIEMIPDETMKEDLMLRQRKVQEKIFIEQLTPEERKQFIRDKARTVALERWKERKLKNLKIEDKTLTDLIPIPAPKLVETPKKLPNNVFGDVVIIIEFIECFRELLLGEEKLRISTHHFIEALNSDSRGFQTFTDIMCYLLPTIIHDDISKNRKELSAPIAGIPINYQTAPELARLCLRNEEDNEALESTVCDDNWQIGKEKLELSEDLMLKLENVEFWELEYFEVTSVLKALVHKVLATAALSVYVEEVEEKVLKCLREKRKYMKQLQKEMQSEKKKRREERELNKEAKFRQPKKARGRPRGYSPKIAALNMKDFFPKSEEEVNPIAAVLQRRLSVENSKKEKAEQVKSEKEKQEDSKRQLVERKYEDIVVKRDNLLRRQPIGFDRDHNRYWVFHSTTPGFFVEKGWVDETVNYNCSKQSKSPSKSPRKDITNADDVKIESSDEDENPLSIVFPASSELEDELEKGSDEDDKPLSFVKSKLSITPMKMNCRGRPPKEAYVLVDEDTQTFPTIEANNWFQYTCMEEVDALLESLSDKGHRESQLIASINLNRDRLQRYFSAKCEVYTPVEDTPNRLKISLKEDIAQIERELIEGWLGSVPDFVLWEAKVLEANELETLGPLLIEAQRNMQLKYLKGFMAPEKRQLNVDQPDEPPEFEDIEGTKVEKWREAVLSCQTYSRLHVLVGLFDSCIKWEKSMATRKCKICRIKVKDDTKPLIMCDKCENSYHWYCLRPPLKEEPKEPWLCPACMPKMTRREEQNVAKEEMENDPEEKDDPTFNVNRQNKGASNKNKSRKNLVATRKLEKECLVCLGRVGLICCSKCSDAYHSECHNPPLMSRARKDWVCFACLNPKLRVQKSEEFDVSLLTSPNARNGNEEEKRKNPYKPRVRTNSGRFVKGAMVKKEEEDLKTIDHDDGSRRSSRNAENRKSYIDESEGDGESYDGSEDREDEEEAQSEDEEEIIDESMNDTIDESMNDTIDESMNDTIDESMNDTIDESMNDTFDESMNDTIDETIDDTLGDDFSSEENEDTGSHSEEDQDDN